MNNYEHRGFTLVELVIVVAISVILLSQVVPGMGNLIKHSQRHSAVSDLITLLNLARSTSVQEQQIVTLCPLDDNNQCTGDWSRPITAFRDPTRSKTLSSPSQVIRIGLPPKHGRLIVKSGNRSYFRFRATGMAREAIGNIVWCPDNGDATVAAQIRINMGGRPQLAKDMDGDGVAEDAYGHPISCEG